MDLMQMPPSSSINRRQFLKQKAVLLASLSSPLLASCVATHAPRKIGGPIGSRTIRSWASDLRGTVIMPGDDPYDSARLVWNLDIDRHPAAVVRCVDVQDVVKTINFARSSGLQVAVRGGGHSAAGHSTCDGGIVIDLGAMNRVDVDPLHGTAHAAAGARVRDLLNATRAHGLVTPTGGCPDVGISGLTLGGGETALTAKYGLACDNVISAQVVTADGQVLMASADENTDLFWAIRGGGGNFGVITKLEYRLYPVAEVLSGFFAFPASRATEALRSYRELMAVAPDELQTALILRSTTEGPSLVFAFTYCGDQSSGDPLVRRWRSKLRPADGNALWGPYGGNFVLPAAPYLGTGAFLPELSDTAIDVLVAYSSEAPPSTVMLANDYHGAVTRVNLADAAYPIRQRGYSLSSTSTWSSAADRSAVLDWVTRFQNALRPLSRGVYVNVLFDRDQDRVPEAYGSNYDRLAAIKAKYDPANFFRFNPNISPAT